MEIHIKKRSYHVISGRLRMELYGLKDDADVALRFKQVFPSIKGILHLEASIITGKILIQYDESVLSLGQLCCFISQFEEMLFQHSFEINYEDDRSSRENYSSLTDPIAYSEIAATYDFSIGENGQWRSPQNIVGSFLSKVPQRARAPADNKVPLPLALSVAGLGILGIKQLFFGRSMLARHPVPFYLAAVLSVSTGYPFIKRRLQKLWREKKFNLDLLLSASALALALIRENLVVLASISLIQYLNWKRRKSVENELLNQEYISKEIESYSRQATKLGLMGAAAALAVTRNPIVPLAVLLAANPRPITSSTEYTWKQAEHMARESKQEIPNNGSVYQLTQTKTVVFEDVSLISTDGTVRKECVPLLSLLTGRNVAFVNNESNVDLDILDQHLNEYGVQLISHNDLKINRREDVLVVIKDQVCEKNKVISFYPYCTFNQLPGIAKTMQDGKDLKKIIKQNTAITKLWNLAGSIIAMPLVISAPLINLIGDALSLTFMSRAKNWTERRFKISHRTHENDVSAAKISWHSKKADEVLRYFDIDKNNGLNTEQVNRALHLYGKNQLVSKTRPHWLKTYAGQFKEFTTQVLAATALLSAFTGHLFDGLIMGSILLINAGIGTIQERKADKAVETMSQFVPPNCRVVRDGVVKEIAAHDLVPGDIVELEAGDRVPADLRIIQSWNLEVNESALTGESLPVEKKEMNLNEDVPVTDRSNMLYMGTHITRGKSKAVVVHIGKNTEMGHLLSLLTEDEDHTTPLQKQVTAISKKFMKGALAVGAIVFITGLLRGMPLTEMVATSVALTASAIPEGLPITITFALTAGIFRMAKKKALVRKLSALETLGRATVICSDKTGTLTKNEMTVKRISTVEMEYEVTGDGYNPEGTIIGKDQSETFWKDVDQILRIGLLCNNSQLLHEEGRWNVKGDPTEGALLSLAAKRGLLAENHNHWKRVEEIPFDSNSGKMSVVCHDENQEEQCFVMSKGSVEKLLANCSHYQKNGNIYPLNEKVRTQIMEQNDAFARQALRVLGFAYKKLDKHAQKDCIQDIDSKLIYVGMAGMIDPPKPEVEKSIREAVKLGIKPVMITGDHPLTALAIAKQIGIYNESAKVVTGQELDMLSDQELKTVIDDIAIYARVTPEHKLRIVTILQQKGHIVAMTGDGVNDSPAIKKADIGIAMGQTGTQVTKEMADMVLKEDHFGSIVDGVKEGRTIIGNIRKAIGCLLSGNLSEILVTSLAVIAGLPLPVVPVQILLMNMLTDALPAMILAVNPGNKTKETKRQEIVDGALYKQVITRGAILGLGSLGLFIWSLGAGMTLDAAQTVAFSTLVAGQLIQTFSWRQADTEETIKDVTKDRFLVSAFGISWLALLSVIYIPPFAAIFKTASLPLWNWGPILLVSAASARLAKPLSNIWIKKHILPMTGNSNPAVA
ncbi:cation-translocating P-type ATPase [Bacillus methanolicus]|uniref:P-type Ca(2+) transporter n=1 Tax=Bacillus methanolicus (strain MGA3 / ATCC 53907) TaxID=796606 RepID=I3EAI6_BACMM|nr:HAD-IC family P-type ATPase [Bacillus methanolicus]AIE60747.1 Cation-transporting ATPase pacL [Bacillus methanolicus MGA3]EIJ83507.1 cation transporter E1-E2 family ATPase [Bacillus methanolicus MGA3]